MRIVGQLCLLTAFVTAGFGAFACVAGGLADRVELRKRGVQVGRLTWPLLTVVMAILAVALIQKDFSFDYVVRSSSRALPWYYSLSALWVGQAGSILLWTWLLAAMAWAFRFQARLEPAPFRDVTFGLLLGCVEFLMAIMVFAADPMKASLGVRTEGAGLSPLLQHPAMLWHPPVVFAGYAAWAVPMCVVVAALLLSTTSDWGRLARPWALLAWAVLGGGILLGAHWAYQELGWGGYWAWDPVENGSLVPWLVGTAFVHGLMAWKHGQTLRRTTVALSVATFALCNWATFLTRSGIFSSVHAFSQSPIGWMFLAWMAVLAAGGVWLLVRHWRTLRPERSTHSMWARESMVLISVVALVLFAIVVIVGTLIAPLSTMWLGRTVQFGPDFYNRVLAPVGLFLLTLTAIVPLVRWRHAPSRWQRRGLFGAACCGLVAAALAWAGGVRSPTALGVAGVAALALATLAWSIVLDGRKTVLAASHVGATERFRQVVAVLVARRRPYAAYAIHLGFVALAVGVAGSSLGTRQHEVEIAESESVEWAGWNVRNVALEQRETPDKLVAEARLEVTRGGAAPIILRPARHLHLLQNEWTSEVAIHSTWRGDLYVILHAGLGEGKVFISLIDNPLVNWLWWGGLISLAGAVVALVPTRRSVNSAAHREPITSTSAKPPSQVRPRAA